MHVDRPLTALAVTLTVLSVGATLLVGAPQAQAASASCVAPPIAHRGGAARAPENTVPAFRRALWAGATQLDLDVRFTSDGVPVVLHDRTVDRTTDGSGPVSAMTMSQLRSLDAGSWFSSEFAGIKVPTLRYVLDFGRTRGATFQVELKVRPTRQQMDDFLNEIRWLGMLDRVRVTSFGEGTILDVRAAEPGLATAIIEEKTTYRSAEAVLSYGSTYVVHHWSVTKARAESWRSAGIEVRPWTVNSVKGWTRMAYDDAGPVITDRPKAYLSWARSFCA
ncbi:MAG TPA: glycerophosphodiester phosphodiesterase family protein [Actinomycetes bacterium]